MAKGSVSLETSQLTGVGKGRWNMLDGSSQGSETGSWSILRPVIGNEWGDVSCAGVAPRVTWK